MGRPRFATVMLFTAIAATLASRAHATGVCEDVATQYSAPRLFDETTQSFAIPGVQPWCGEVQVGGSLEERRGTVSFVELRDIHGKVLGILSTATGANAKRLEEALGAFETVKRGGLPAALAKRGYTALVSKAKSCKLTTTWTDVEKGGGWRSATLQLDVKDKGKSLLRTKLGTGSIARRGAQILRFHVIAKQSAIAILAIVPSCSGPPPGYFEPNDSGQCYLEATPVAMMLDATSSPAIAACF